MGAAERRTASSRAHCPETGHRRQGGRRGGVPPREDDDSIRRTIIDRSTTLTTRSPFWSGEVVARVANGTPSAVSRADEPGANPPARTGNRPRPCVSGTIMYRGAPGNGSHRGGSARTAAPRRPTPVPASADRRGGRRRTFPRSVPGRYRRYGAESVHPAAARKASCAGPCRPGTPRSALRWSRGCRRDRRTGSTVVPGLRAGSGRGLPRDRTRDAERLSRDFVRFRMRQRQLAALLEAHGLPSTFDHCPAGSDPREILRA